MKPLALALTVAIACVAQQPCPLSVVKLVAARTYWYDGSPKDMTVKVQNVSGKEVSIAQYQFTYTDKLGRVTGVIYGQPVEVHEAGRKTLRPGKSGTSWFEAPFDHPNDHVDVAVVLVKFVDGTLWESKDGEQSKNDR